MWHWPASVIEYETSDGPVVRVGRPGPQPVHLLFSEPSRPYGDDPTLDFLVRASGEWVSIETSVSTWHGDGLDAFLATLAEDFRRSPQQSWQPGDGRRPCSPRNRRHPARLPALLRPIRQQQSEPLRPGNTPDPNDVPLSLRCVQASAGCDVDKYHHPHTSIRSETAGQTTSSIATVTMRSSPM
ncbi:DUF6228 family protein [Streptomyces sp. NPDC051658]|uniref:DUF6228 family protein n=1 Tax=Streptomyces sp. NPDC051658 TaxID=3365667 RepID=UPI0037B748A0